MSVTQRSPAVVPAMGMAAMPSLRWSHERMRSTLTFTATRLLSMAHTSGSRSSV